MSDGRVLTYALEDRFFRRRIEELVREHKIQTIVETGLDKGLSAVELASIVPVYIGIDIDPTCVAATWQKMNAVAAHTPLGSYALFVGDSAEQLKVIEVLDPTLYFLDAHCFGDTDCPIREEIAAIPRGKGILAFHDIWVPGRAHGGFSPLIDGVPTRFDYDLIKPALTAWSPGHRIEYLTEAETPLAPGVMFAFPEVTP